jgi:spore germination protein GerM
MQVKRNRNFKKNKEKESNKIVDQLGSGGSLTPVILATWEVEDHRLKPAWVNSSRSSLERIHHNKGLVEWLKQ